MKIGDIVQIKKEWWPRTSKEFKLSFGSIRRKGIIMEIIYDNYIEVEWEKIGKCGGTWTDSSIELYKENNHPHTTIFK